MNGIRRRPSDIGWRAYFRAMGPGVVTGASDDDPSGVATYAQAGAQFRYSLLWSALLTLPLMAAVQEICDRTALATGRGLGELSGAEVPTVAAAALRAARRADRREPVEHHSRHCRDRRGYEPHAPRSDRALGPRWRCSHHGVDRRGIVRDDRPGVQSSGVGAPDLRGRHVRRNTRLVTSRAPYADSACVVHEGLRAATSFAVLGTTISPYLFFWQNAPRLEELPRRTRRRRRTPPNHRPVNRAANRKQRTSRADVFAGMALSNIVMFRDHRVDGRHDWRQTQRHHHHSRASRPGPQTDTREALRNAVSRSGSSDLACSPSPC